MGIQQKGITVDELEGFREAMLELAVKIDLSEFDAMDIVGTGGDGKDTFNISTTSAFVIAGAGQNIAKHGNHGVSSAVGSSTVLEYFSFDSLGLLLLVALSIVTIPALIHSYLYIKRHN